MTTLIAPAAGVVEAGSSPTREWYQGDPLPFPDGSFKTWVLTSQAAFKEDWFTGVAIRSTTARDLDALGSESSWRRTVVFPSPGLGDIPWPDAVAWKKSTRLATAMVWPNETETRSELEVRVVDAADGGVTPLPRLGFDTVPSRSEPTVKLAAGRDALYAAVLQQIDDVGSLLDVYRYDVGDNSWGQPTRLFPTPGEGSAWLELISVSADADTEGAAAVGWVQLTAEGKYDPRLNPELGLKVATTGGGSWTRLEPISPAAPDGREVRILHEWNTHLELHDGVLRMLSVGKVLDESGETSGRHVFTAAHRLGQSRAWTDQVELPSPGYPRTVLLGRLRDRWAVAVETNDEEDPDPVLVLQDGEWTQVADAGRVYDFGGGRFISDERPALIHSVDTTPPLLRPSSVRPYHSPAEPVSMTASDAGGLTDVQCTFDGEVLARANPCAAAVPSSHGEHELKVTAEDRAGMSTTRTLRWTTDGQRPWLRWRSTSPHWPVGQRQSFAWTGGDAVSGLDGYRARVVTGWYDKRARRATSATLPASRRDLAWHRRQGVTTCVQPMAYDVVGNTRAVARRCSVTPLNDRRLDRIGQTKRLTGARFFRGTATVLKRNGSSLRLKPRARVVDVALRLQTCRRCGKVEIVMGDRRWRVDLQSASSRMRTVDLRWRQPPTSNRLRITKLTGGRVLVDAVWMQARA